MYKLRTIDKSGDYIELKSYACVIKACSMAELLSDPSLHSNVIVSSTKTREMKNFVNGQPI